MRKAIALLRVSTGAQAGPDREGLPAQRSACARIAKAHGLELVETVELAGVSGAAVLADPRFAALLGRLRDPALSGVVVADFDRLFRPDRFAYFAILDAFADTGSVIFTSSGVIDPGSEHGALMGLLTGKMSGLERRRLKARTMRAKDERRAKGWRAEALVGLPRGVTFDHATKRWAYTAEAEPVREAFALFLGGVRNLAELARRCGWRRPGRDGGSWAARSVLSQPLYAGVYRASRRWVRGRPVPRPPEEVLEVPAPGLEPPLIPPADFAKAQAILAELRASRAPRRDAEARGLVYLGHLDCAECGGALQVWNNGTTGRPYPAYRCGRARHGSCAARSSSARMVEAAVGQALAARLGTEATLRRLLEVAIAEAESRGGPEAAELERRRVVLDQRRGRVLRQHELGHLGELALTKRLDELEGERAALELAQARLAAPLRVDPGLVRAMVRVFGRWALLGQERQRAALSSMQVRVAVRVPGPRRVEVVSVELGLLDRRRVYK